MENKHTPGPWFHGVLSNGLHNSKINIRDKNQLYILDGETDFNFETTVANARLIAAAPQLLAALLQVISDDPTFLEIPMVADAIKKATE